MDKIKHLENKYSIARYDLIRECEGDELRFYLYLKLYAINKHEAFPTYKTIVADLNWSKMKISRTLKKMVKKERLKIGKTQIKTKMGKQACNIYDITWYDRVNNQGKRKEGGNKTLLPFKWEGGNKTGLELVANNITNNDLEFYERKTKEFKARAGVK